MSKAASVIIVVLIVSAFFSVTPLCCQDENTPIWDQDGTAPVVKTIDGRVVSVDPQNLQISVESVERFVFFVPIGAKIINKDGFAIELSTIKPDNYAMVEYYDDKTGKHIARKISVEYRD